jgi:DNA polymerase-3 subunit alpha
MAANLTAVMGDTDKVHQFRGDLPANKLVLLGPDINSGGFRFEPVDAQTIRYGLGAVKGTGESAIAAIVAAREAGPFQDLFDFCRRIDRRAVNRRAVEALVRAGAFDALHAGSHRASVLASVGIALEAAEQAARDSHQVSLFGGAGESVASAAKLVEVPRWSGPEQLVHEKTALGFYFSGHPFDYYRKELASFVRGRLCDLAPRQDLVLLAGIITETRMQQTRSGRMAVLTLEDGTAQVEVTAFAELFEEKRELLKDDKPVVIQGKVTEDQFSGGLRVRAERILDLATARNRFARVMRLSLNGEAQGAAGAARLKKLLEPYRVQGAGGGKGGCPVEIRYDNGRATVQLRLPEQWRVSPDERLLADLRGWLKPENVEVIYGSGTQ